MEPNGKFYTQYPQQQYAPQPQLPQKSRGKAILLTLLVLVLIGGAAAGAYVYQQQRIDALNVEKTQLAQRIADTSVQDAEGVEPNQFSYSKTPFVFSYPAEWTLTSSEPVTYTETLPNEYGIELLAPGTVRSVTASGTPDVISENGARVTIKKTVTTETDAQKALGTFAGTAPTFKDVTVAGLKGVEYEYMNDGPKYLATAFVKDGALFVIRFDAEDDADLTKNDYYKTYQSVVNSFQFK
jgi:Tfp pilus assembly protein PilX